jgi:glycine cleavage system H protein
MSDIPTDLKYRESHEWVREEDGEGVVVGITDHAQAELGDMVFVELPEPGMSYTQGDACAVIESVKAASDIYAPLSGEVVEVNDALEDDPGMVNNDPYGDGWLFRMEPSNPSELEGLMDADAYSDGLD